MSKIVYYRTRPDGYRIVQYGPGCYTVECRLEIDGLDRSRLLGSYSDYDGAVLSLLRLEAAGITE